MRRGAKVSFGRSTNFGSASSIRSIDACRMRSCAGARRSGSVSSIFRVGTPVRGVISGCRAPLRARRIEPFRSIRFLDRYRPGLGSSGFGIYAAGCPAPCRTLGPRAEIRIGVTAAEDPSGGAGMDHRAGGRLDRPARRPWDVADVAGRLRWNRRGDPLERGDGAATTCGPVPVGPSGSPAGRPSSGSRARAAPGDRAPGAGAASTSLRTASPAQLRRKKRTISREASGPLGSV